METRPKIKPELATADKLLNLLSLLSLLGMWGVVLYHYSRLPDIINIHFDVNGKANGTGSKATLFILPVAGSITFFLLMVLNNYPYLFNYPFILTPENVKTHYTLATRSLRMMNAGIMLIMLFASYVMAGEHPGRATGILLFVMIICVTAIPIAYYFIYGRKAG